MQVISGFVPRLSVFLFGSRIISLFVQPWNVLVRRYRRIRQKNPVFRWKTEKHIFCCFGKKFLGMTVKWPVL